VGVWGNMRGNVQCPADAAGGSCPEWPPGNNMRRISNRGLQPRLVSQGDRWPPANAPQILAQSTSRSNASLLQVALLLATRLQTALFLHIGQKRLERSHVPMHSAW